jgi:hypothetical protein
VKKPLLGSEIKSSICLFSHFKDLPEDYFIGPALIILWVSLVLDFLLIYLSV